MPMFLLFPILLMIFLNKILIDLEKVFYSVSLFISENKILLVCDICPFILFY